VAHWALTGQPLFIAKTPAEMLLHQVQSLPTPPSKISELPVPPAFEELLMACLEKDPAMRPASALELESELARVRCEDPWSEERARLWWEAHAPNLGAPRTA
jgi:serine/threonine protein kinase